MGFLCDILGGHSSSVYPGASGGSLVGVRFSSEISGTYLASAHVTHRWVGWGRRHPPSPFFRLR